MKIRFNCVGFFERRTKTMLELGRVIEQERVDQVIERQWRAKVKANWKERARVLKVPRAWLSPKQPKPGLLAHQAD